MTHPIYLQTYAWILIIFYTVYSILIGDYLRAWFKIKKFVPNLDQSNITTKVSIIIAARNEELHISDCLEYLIKQDFPFDLLQIIVVDDHSTDLTVSKTDFFKKSNPEIDLLIVQLEDPSVLGKKAAINAGISHATGDLIVTTDADCRMDKYWLKSIIQYYVLYKPKMICCPVAFDENRTVFGKLQSLEFVGLVGITAASIYKNLPLMCNGANLAYEKKAFIDVGGFDGNEKIASGDDTFLMLKIARKYPLGVKFLKSNEAIVYTSPQNSIKGFFIQRKRWASKNTKYKNTWILAVATLVYLINFLMVCSWVFYIFGYIDKSFILLQFFAKCIIEFNLLYMVSIFFKKRKLLLLFLPAQVFYPFYIVIVATTATFGKYTWKERFVK